jgi:hypothetical protein
MLVILFVLIGVAWAVAPRGTTAALECGIHHTVVSGQNLFRISIRYGVSMHVIAAHNGIADVRRIYAGQVLYIPCPGGITPDLSGIPAATVVTTTDVSVNPPAITTTTTTTVIPGEGVNFVDCTGFRGTSPDGFPDGVTTFYWDPPRAGRVEGYQVYVLNTETGRLVGSFSTFGSITSVSGDVGLTSIGRGIFFSWYAVALVDGVEVCRTPTLRLRREWTDRMGS